MNRLHWCVAALVLFAGHLFATLVVDWFSLEPINQSLDRRIHRDYDHQAQVWQQRLTAAGDDFPAAVQAIEAESGFRARLLHPDPLEILDNPGLDGIYYAALGYQGIFIVLLIDESTAVELGPMPNTALAVWKITAVPALIHTLIMLACFAFIMALSLAPLRLLTRQISKPGTTWSARSLLLGSPSAAEALVNHYRELVQDNQTLRDATATNIENQRDFLHGVAHEFRAPLARLRFAMDLDEPDRQQKVDNIVEDMDELVTEILQYSRYRHGLFEVHPQSLDLGELLERVASAQLEDRDTLKLVFGPGVHQGYQALTDPTLLERALTNLLLNAGRFAGKQIKADIEPVEGLFAIVIEDDGPGVPPGKRALIFEPFTRLDPSRSRDSGGTGLGLAIVDGIVKKLNGHVAVEDSELGGARFILSIPKKA